MAGRGLCGICQATAQQACGGCGCVFYCGKEHQREHWPTHRPECQSYKIVSSPEAGQYLVAGRQLKAGQCVLKDKPLVVGPPASTSLLCLGCSTEITSEDFVKCPQCEWPLCSFECAKSILHKAECPILAKDEKRLGAPKELCETPRYDVIMVIRCLLLQTSDPPTWDVVYNMASHFEQRMIDKEPYHMTTVYYLTQILHVDFDAEIVHRIRGVIATNGLEIRSEKGARMRALYPRIRLFNHSCVPNMHLTCGPQGIMEARTAVPIEFGTPLHISYTATTMPLWERQASLREAYYFTCSCPRCDDFTELGTYFSCPRCPKCNGLYMQPSRKHENTIWVCQTCKYEQTSLELRECVDETIKILNESFDGRSCRQVAKTLDQAEEKCHPCHYIWMRLAQLALYKMRYNKHSLELLRLRRDIWLRLLSLYEIFEPGLTRRRGMSLLETGMAIYDLALREYKENDRYYTQCKYQVGSALTYFQEAANILCLDPSDSLQATLTKTAKEKLREAQGFLERVCSRGVRADAPSESEKTMGVLEKCEECGADEARLTCGECEQAHYCSPDHQEAHRDLHKDVCQPSVIEQQDPLRGRYLVVSHTVKAGELLFRETPIALGPRATSHPVCLGCHKPIESLDFPTCPKCSWPLCSLDCASSKLHEEECSILANDSKRLGIPTDLSESPCYDTILVLRCLLLRDTDPKAWRRLLSMASHAVQVDAEEDTNHLTTIHYIQDVLKAKFQPKLIHHSRGAIMTNCFEWRNPLNVSLRGVYPKTGRINHSCLPNVTLSSDRDGVMYARAAVDIKALSPLYITYTGTLEPIWERQAYLNEIHYFSCDCARCSDPTELGLHYSSPKCEYCKRQYLVPKTWVGETVWECPACHLVQPDFVIKTEYIQWISKFDCNDTFIMAYPKGVRNTLERVEAAFHPTHHVWVTAAQVAIRTMKANESRESFLLRRDLWEKLLRIYSILEPGMTRRRGMTFYELGICQADLTRVEMKEGRLTDHFFRIYMKEALQYLQEALDILRLEAPDSHERRWYVKAVQAADEVRHELELNARPNGICSLANIDINNYSLEKVRQECIDL